MSALVRKSSGPVLDREALSTILRCRAQFETSTDAQLREMARRRTNDRTECFALAALTAERTLGLKPFDVQILGALAMTEGKIVEMQTGEGKTLAAVAAVAWYVWQGFRVHVLTANDYLAERDAEWMAEVYRNLNISVASVNEASSRVERRNAYDCEVTYTTPNEAGFDSAWPAWLAI